jgi:large subunit ribosomal protein L25
LKSQSLLVLRAKPRVAAGKNAKHLRKEGQVPVSVYRHGEESVHISVPRDEFHRVYRRAGTSGIVELQVEGSAPIRVLFHRLERHPISGQMLSAALLEVRMAEKMSIEVPIRLIGEAPAVKEFHGTLVEQRDRLHVEALPGNLPSHIDADLSVLKTLGDKITVASLPLPDGVAVLDNLDDLVATVVGPTKAEAEEVPEVVETAPEAPAKEPAAE